MSALRFASPQLVAAARDCADVLARVPRVVQPADAPRPRSKGMWKQSKPRARKVRPVQPRAELPPIDARLMQAAQYFLSRHPEYTKAERVRFGRAHGLSVAEFRRAIRAARNTLQQGASEAGRSHTPSREGSTPSPATTLRGERLECRGQQVWESAADAGSRAKSFTAAGSAAPAGRGVKRRAEARGGAIFPRGINASARDEHALVQPTNDAQAQTCENDADAGCRLGAVAFAVRSNFSR